jgi:hypothetical protein
MIHLNVITQNRKEIKSVNHEIWCCMENLELKNNRDNRLRMLKTIKLKHD